MISPKTYYRALRYRYKLDPQELSFLISNVRKGDVVVDVGAHKGGYTYWFHRQIGANGMCYAFEPQSNIYSKLSRGYLRKLIHGLNQNFLEISNDRFRFILRYFSVA